MVRVFALRVIIYCEVPFFIHREKKKKKYEIIIAEHPSHSWQYITPFETINQSIRLHEGGAFR